MQISAVHAENLIAESDVSLEGLLAELDHYKKEVGWLAQSNELHARLAKATDIQGMVEAYSVWLQRQISHELVALKIQKDGTMHTYCSAHGPVRRRAVEMAERVAGRVDSACRDSDFKSREFHVIVRQIDNTGCWGELVILRRSPVSHNEDRLLHRSLPLLAEPLLRGIAYERLFEQARRDSLTGLPNRRVFEERVTSLLENAKRYGTKLTVASMDLDNFKEINDTRGHAAGDEALKRVAETMAAMVRNGDLLARMGGDEFVLVLPHTDAAGARHIAERLCSAVRDLDIKGGRGKRLGVSIGLVEWQKEIDLDQLLRTADEALYQAKNAGRSCVWIA